jgi:ribosomal protein S18 acetylase RimI-like enzyme
MPLVIRPYRDADLPAFEHCVAVMQDAERVIDPALPPGSEVAAAYSAQVRDRCAAPDGAILVAEHNAEVAGFVAVLAHVPPEDLDEAPGTHALVSDLVVLPRFRRLGIGAALLRAAEAHARERGARLVRVAVLAGNATAEALYVRAGYTPWLVTMRKQLADDAAAASRPGHPG